MQKTIFTTSVLARMKVKDRGIAQDGACKHVVQSLCDMGSGAYLTPCRRGAGIGTVKIVFSPPAFQLLYSAHAQVNTMKEG